eukprot:COSAG01_NODE_3621_length_5860_cov_4.719840_3_plen_581_part_00
MLPLLVEALLLLGVGVTRPERYNTAGSSVASQLDSVVFARPKASGLVTNEMVFEPVQLAGEYQEDYPYLSDAPGRWSTEGDESASHGGLHYLFERTAAEPQPRWAVPPTGMRSSVPLGALGGGSLELRADGALRDFRMLNNHPAALSPQGMKRDFEAAAFGLWIGGRGKLLRTQLPSPPSSSRCTVVIVSVSGRGGRQLRVPVGADLRQLPLNTSKGCANACCALLGCAAFLWERQTDAHMGGCVEGKPCCFLKSSLGKTIVKTLRTNITIGNISRPATHFPPPQPTDIPRVAALSYSGAFPVSRLDIVDAALLSGGSRAGQRGSAAQTSYPPHPPQPPQLSASLFAFSRFAMHDANATAAPAITFALVLRNPTPHAVRASVLFTLPDLLGGGGWSAYPHTAHTLCLTKPGTTTTSGELCIRAFADGAAAMNTSWVATTSLGAAWGLFAKGEGTFSHHNPSEPDDQPAGPQGAHAVTVSVPPRANVTAGFVLAWMLPHRNFAGEFVGQFYSNLFPDANAVAADAVSNMQPSLQSVLRWNQWVMDNDALSTGLKDLLVNSPSTFLKTGLWLSDSRWRQYES